MIDKYLSHIQNCGLAALVGIVGEKLEDIEKWKEDVPEGSGLELWASDDEKWMI